GRYCSAWKMVRRCMSGFACRWNRHPRWRAQGVPRGRRRRGGTRRQGGGNWCGWWGERPAAPVGFFRCGAGAGSPPRLRVWGTVQWAARELGAQVGGVVGTPCGGEAADPEPAPRSDLVTIAPAPPRAEPAKPAATWESLPPTEQQIHLRAQRFARVQAAEIR